MHPADVEKYVLGSLDHVGWYRSCWFPQVQRLSLNFPDGPDAPSDEGFARRCSGSFGLVRLKPERILEMASSA
jgi:hypothetical protein